MIKILQICNEEKAVIHLTTNGTFLGKFGFDTFLKAPCLRQINFSLHSFKDNFPDKDIRPYLFDILEFSKQALIEKPELYINYRLWNLASTTESKAANQEIIDHITEFFQISINERIDVALNKSKNLLTPIKIFSSSIIKRKKISISLAGLIGRFYSRK